MHRDLSHIQADFASALLDPANIDSVLAIFSGNPELNRERFQLYRGNVLGVWEQSCASAYPVLRQLVGTAFFADLSRMYGLAYPSQTGDLNEFGAHMPAFLATVEQCNDYPYLADVARLEWQVHRAYYAKLQPSVEPTRLAQIEPELYGAIRFGLQPCCAVVASDWATGQIWQVHQTAAPTMPTDLRQHSWCLVWRQEDNWHVQVDLLTPGSGVALEAIQRGRPLGEVIEVALAADPEFNLPLTLADWFQKKLVISISTETSAS